MRTGFAGNGACAHAGTAHATTNTTTNVIFLIARSFAWRVSFRRVRGCCSGF
jgi:hypothetical protein